MTNPATNLTSAPKVLLLIVFLSGCSHSVDIDNISQPYVKPVLKVGLYNSDAKHF